MAIKCTVMKVDACFSASALMRLSITHAAAKAKSSTKIKKRTFFIARVRKTVAGSRS